MPIDGRGARAVSEAAAGCLLASVTVAAPADRVFRALASPEIVTWWVRPGVFTTSEWAGDVRGGGRWRASGTGRGRPYTLEGEYLEVDAPRRLVHTWRAAGSDRPTMVTYVLDAVDGGTRVTLRHSGFESPEACDATAVGWETSFGRLAAHLGAVAPDTRALLRRQYAVSDMLLRRTVEDLTDGEARRVPNAALSPIVWQVGHLAVVDASVCRKIPAAAQPGVPDEYGSFFGISTGGAADYPPFVAVLDCFSGARAALADAIADADLGAAETSPPMPGMWTTVGEMLAAVNAHHWYHIGKMNSIRALLGKPRLFG